MSKILDSDEVEIYQTPAEQDNLKHVLELVEVKGDLIEVGVYMGGSAKIIAKAFPERHLYLFDTFKGLPNDISVVDGDYAGYKIGDMDEANFELVKHNLRDYPNVSLYEGRFPDTANPIKGKKFAFAHIDVDIYVAMKESLDFIYPRMVKGGLVLLHDYPAHAGVRKAVGEFLKANNLTVEIIGVEGRQALIKI